MGRCLPSHVAAKSLKSKLTEWMALQQWLDDKRAVGSKHCIALTHIKPNKTMSLIADVAWIRRQIPKHVPDKVKLSADELRNLIQGGEPETSEMSDTEEPMDDGTQQPRGIRGSSPDVPDEGTDRYRLEQYDENSDERPNPLAGIATFATPMDDPHITAHVDSDEEDKSDFEIEPDDNLVAVAKIDKNEYTLEIYLYNEAEGDWYVHHDYLLAAPPLCVEPLQFDPEKDNKKGNLLAVGNLDATIGIWDLDLVNSAVPVYTLGGKKAKRRQRRDGSAQAHTDAVLSLAWNHLGEHILASGSADESVILWDLEEMKPSTVVTHFNGKIQAVAWHPAEMAVLLTGTLTGQVGVTECRAGDGLSQQWAVSGEVERLMWDHFNPFYFYVATDDGHLYYMDTRKSEPVFMKRAHEKAARSVTQSCYTKGLLSTCGEDGLLKIWRLKEDSSDVELLKTHDVNLGGLHVCRFSPDSGAVLVVGGEKEEMVKIVEVSKFEEVRTAFS